MKKKRITTKDTKNTKKRREIEEMLSRDGVDEEKKKTKRRMGVMANTTYFSHPSFRFLLPIFGLSLPALRALRALRGLFPQSISFYIGRHTSQHIVIISSLQSLEDRFQIELFFGLGEKESFDPL
jgi:hypothetical protein